MRRVILAAFMTLCLVLPAQAESRADVVRVFLPVAFHAFDPSAVFVTHIVDGDTIDVQIGGVTQRVRYIGIDTPEQGDCYYSEAKAQNSALVLGQYVRLVKDISETDRYDRLLRYVYAGSTFVNAELVRGGYAVAYHYPPDVAQDALLTQMQAEAQAARRGVWAACYTPTPTATMVPTFTPIATMIPTVTPTATPEPGGIFITDTGTKYHRDGCRYLDQSKHEVTCSWAIGHGYTACGVCHPACP